MSDIGQARKFLDEALEEMDELYDALDNLYDKIKLALHLMVREPPIRKAPGRRTPITDKMRESIIAMAKNNPDMTMAEIAHAHGLANQARASEVLTGKRPKKSGDKHV